MSSLPEEVLSQSCRRVRLASLTMAVLWTLTAALNVAVPGAPGWPTPGLFVAAAGVAFSLLMAWAAGRPGRVSEMVLDLGLLWEIVTGLLMAILTEWQPMVVPMRISWLCVLVVMYPAIAPTTARKTLVASLITVSMDPLMYLVAVLRGVEHGTTAQTLVWMFAPNYASAVLSVVPAHVIRQLGRQVKKARDLGSYRLGSLLGSGGMGEVYRAQHHLLVRPAAVKLIKADTLGMGEGRRVALERFRREAQAAALLQSPHTIALYDFGATDDGTFYYAMELLDGVSLEQLVERFGPVPAERAVHLVRQACESLAEAHGRGLIHRDIKPSNIVATRLGLEVDFVKVLDFGLVKFDPRAAQASPTLTAPQTATGTPAFMAPEAALGERTADYRMDVYSLGCVLYWLVTGQLVFDGGDSPTAAMVRHVTDVPEPPSQRTELPIPLELDAVIMACLAKKAEDRPAGAEALATALAAVPFTDPWTPARARHWWQTHLPQGSDSGASFDEGTLMQKMGSE
jgi:serine/threonine-protein kinase